jgi:hypothetical protein
MPTTLENCESACIVHARVVPAILCKESSQIVPTACRRTDKRYICLRYNACTFLVNPFPWGLVEHVAFGLEQYVSNFLSIQYHKPCYACQCPSADEIVADIVADPTQSAQTMFGKLGPQNGISVQCIFEPTSEFIL